MKSSANCKNSDLLLCLHAVHSILVTVPSAFTRPLQQTNFDLLVTDSSELGKIWWCALCRWPEAIQSNKWTCSSSINYRHFIAKICYSLGFLSSWYWFLFHSRCICSKNVLQCRIMLIFCLLSKYIQDADLGFWKYLIFLWRFTSDILRVLTFMNLRFTQGWYGMDSWFFGL